MTLNNFEVKKLIDDVLDQSSFVETLSMVRGKSSLGEAAGEGVISGFGTVNDTRVGVFGIIHEVLLGGIGKKSAKKISHIVDSAAKVGAPVIGFIDSEGARFLEGIKALEGYAGIMESFSKAYGRVPLILAVTGADYGMLSYLSSLCDLCVALPKARLASSSPLILAANAKVDQKDVANIKIHTEKTGIITNIAEDGGQLRQLVGDFLSILTEPQTEPLDDLNRTAPGLVNGTFARDIIRESFDDGKFIELRAAFGKEAITGFARLGGLSVGVIANNGEINGGRLTAAAAQKITAFLNICGNFSVPIVTITDCGGVINDLNQENYDLIRSVSDLLFAISTCPSPKISLISGSAIGIGYIAFAGKRFFDYSVAWDGASIGMLSDTQTATLLFSDLIAQAEDKEGVRKELALNYGKDNSAAAIVAESGYIDNVINPALTRQYLITALMTFAEKR